MRINIVIRGFVNSRKSRIVIPSTFGGSVVREPQRARSSREERQYSWSTKQPCRGRVLRRQFPRRRFPCHFVQLGPRSAIFPVSRTSRERHTAACSAPVPG